VDGVRWRRTRQPAQVGEVPHFDEPARELFDELLATTRTYLEFGSGGSTVLASRVAQTVVCVETDREYLDAVRAAVGDAPARMIYCHADIGTTAQWGAPLVKLGTASQRRRWAHYPWRPWEVLDNEPDVILIDGRFRVASAAASMLRAPAARILFDDYTDRPFYWAVDAIGDRVAQAGRMVEFRRKASTTDGDLQLVVEAYAADWR
jgi:hypothetical protein